MFDPSIRILVVDDMMTMRKLVIKNLKEMGFTDFTEAGNGALGWQRASEAKPKFDLIISDWNMPESTGIDLLKRVRGDQHYKDTPFVLLTAETEKKQVVEALAAGASSYIVKPFSKETLLNQIEALHKSLSQKSA